MALKAVRCCASCAGRTFRYAWQSYVNEVDALLSSDAITFPMDGAINNQKFQ